jgi:hypothetical protein
LRQQPVQAVGGGAQSDEFTAARFDGAEARANLLQPAAGLVVHAIQISRRDAPVGGRQAGEGPGIAAHCPCREPVGGVRLRVRSRAWHGARALPAIAGLQGEEREGPHQHQDQGDTQGGQEPHSASLFCHC